MSAKKPVEKTPAKETDKTVKPVEKKEDKTKEKEQPKQKKTEIKPKTDKKPAEKSRITHLMIKETSLLEYPIIRYLKGKNTTPISVSLEWISV